MTGYSTQRDLARMRSGLTRREHEALSMLASGLLRHACATDGARGEAIASRRCRREPAHVRPAHASLPRENVVAPGVRRRVEASALASSAYQTLRRDGRRFDGLPAEP